MRVTLISSQFGTITEDELDCLILWNDNSMVFCVIHDGINETIHFQCTPGVAATQFGVRTFGVCLLGCGYGIAVPVMHDVI